MATPKMWYNVRTSTLTTQTRELGRWIFMVLHGKNDLKIEYKNG